jgi:phosphoglycolate phosphatase-like HAD superfamily hydrolase
MAIRGRIYDLDGTLVRSLPIHRYTVVGKTIKDLGGLTSPAGIDRFWYETHRNTIIRVVFCVDPEDFWRIYRKHDQIEIRRQHTKPYEDISALKEIKKQGIVQGIVTGAPPHIASLKLDMLPKGVFGSIVIANGLVEGMRVKPDPMGIELCMKELGLDKSETEYVGNGEEDILAARNAGVGEVLIDRGEG